MKNLQTYVSEALDIVMVNEAFQCSWLEKLQKTFKKLNDDYIAAMKEAEVTGSWSKPTMSAYNSFKSMLQTISMGAGVEGIRWDKITDDDIITYKPKNGKFKDFLHDIWKRKKNGIIIGLDAEDYVSCIFCNGVLFKVNIYRNTYGFDKSGWKVYKGELKDYIREHCVTCGCLEFDYNNDPKGLLIKADDADSKTSRAANQEGIVRNDNNYYKKIAQENRERWKKTIRQNRMNNKDFTNFESRITKIIYDYADLDPFDYMENYDAFNMYNNMGQLINNGTSYSSSSLVTLYYKLYNALKEAKEGSSYAERELKDYEQAMENKLVIAEEMMNKLREAV